MGDDESIVERQVQPGNATLVAAFPPISGTGPVATLRKCPPTSLTLEDLVRAGTMSRAMSSFLTSAVAGHVNILVTTAPGADARSIIGSLLAAVPSDEHVVVAHDSGCQLALPRNATSILTPPTQEGAAAVRLAARLGPDCLFVTNSAGAITSEVLDAVAGGCDGVVAVMRAPTLQHAFSRVVPEIAALRPGLPIDAVREWLNASFDVAVEVVRLRDGRSRVARIAEPAGVEGNAIALRDIFAFTVERTASGGAVEGSFHPSGVMPKVAENLQARGIPLDPGLFRR
jgi:pilus assembly protein CpaF